MPYPCGVHKLCPFQQKETVPAMCVVNLQFACALVSFPMIVVFGLGMGLHVCMCTKLEKWRPSQRTATTECYEWLLLTRLNFSVHQFCAKVTVTLNCLRDIVV